MDLHTRRAPARTSLQAGFTLIELLTTLSILGLIAGAIAASFSSSLRVRSVMIDRSAQLEEIQSLARTVRDDLEHLVPIPHALRVGTESLLLLRQSPQGDLTIVRYRRDVDPMHPGHLLRETHVLEARALSAWSESSLGDGQDSALPVHFSGPAAPIFHLPTSVEWMAMEHGDGRWRPSDGENPSAIRAVDMMIGSTEASSARIVGSRRGSRAPWRIRIALPMRLPEGART